MLGITFGSNDQDSFNYDVNTGRLTQYLFTVGTGSQNQHQATLQWNPNGSLSTLNVVKDFNIGNLQTCAYTHDDLARIASVNCGSGKWGQNFTYDPFGNIWKTVPSGNTGVTFQPTYNPDLGFVETTNLFYGSPYSYDLNGNLLADGIHNYTWNAEGKTTSIDSVTLTYDALGRAVEQQNGSSYTEIVYSVDGSKLALMNGQNFSKAYVPLPGGATAVYNSSGLAYYTHSDWLGSDRVTSSPTSATHVIYDGAYAPFGESYAEYVNGGTAQGYHSFTGENEDTAQGLDDFLFREYSSAQQGRWISPDPDGLDAVELTDPQSWNRYSYVYNRPCGLVDIQGLSPCKITVSGATELGAVVVTYLNKILGPDVQVDFIDAGTADFVLQQNKQLGNEEGGLAEPLNRIIDLDNGYLTQKYVEYANLGEYPPIAYNLDLGFARVLAHEIGHKFFGSDHPGGVMSDIGEQGHLTFDPDA